MQVLEICSGDINELKAQAGSTELTDWTVHLQAIFSKKLQENILEKLEILSPQWMFILNKEIGGKLERMPSLVISKCID